MAAPLVNIVDIVNPAQAIHRRIINELKDLLLRVWVSPLAR
jgi:hypothetical protein